ncbi:CASP8 and FADD-like apoptosis regulator [Ambystoma mexicanum]|uniref:CASP8 and FADD-like apoptosis regulator n=1 Tax=Ambystoma mexicanum TaxID=8296 RepID=UPI0037E90F3B
MPGMTVSNQVPSSLLYQIEQELGDDERETLGFMCRDVAPDLPTHDVRGLLDALNKQGLLYPHGLAELLYRARRFDLLKRLLNIGKAAVETLLERKSMISEYRVLMLDISEQLDRKDVESIIFLLGDYVGHGRLAKAKTFLAVAIELEKLNLLAPHKIDLLEKCLQNIHRVDLSKRMQKYKHAGHVSSKSSVRMYMNALQTSLPNLSITDPSHNPEIRESVVAKAINGPMLCPAAERISIQESGASVCQGLDERYKMQSQPLGICLIIDCIGNDAGELKKTFTALHFEVQCFFYVNLDDMIQTVQDVALTPRHRHYDSFVCVLISRGSPKAVFGIDQSFQGFELDRLRKLFTGASCPGLLGKPKLFFIQNYIVPGGLRELDSLLEVDEDKCRFLATDGRWQSFGIPNEADIFWSHCKVDSSVLQRSSNASSYYLFCLSQLLRDHHTRSLHLQDIHTELNRRVYERNETADPGDHYSLLLQHTLRKKLFLVHS